MRSRLSKICRHGALALLASTSIAVLAGCSSKYHWQDATDETGQFQAQYPAAPVMDTQDVEINGKSVPLRMQTASAGAQVFAIGTLVLPANSTEQDRSAGLDFLMQGMAHNAGSAPAPQDIPMKGKDGRSLAGKAWQVNGTVPGTHQAQAVTARFVATNDRVYEIAVVAEHEPPKDEVSRFFDSFKPF